MYLLERRSENDLGVPVDDTLAVSQQYVFVARKERGVLECIGWSMTSRLKEILLVRLANVH